MEVERMEEEIQMPISMDWNREEIIDAINFYETIEKAYYKAVPREDILFLYQRFQSIVGSKSEEKQYLREFDQAAGVSSWKTIQKARQAKEGEKIKMT